MSTAYFPHKRFNEQAGEYDYFFPMEVPDKSGREFAKANGQQVVKARLGCRVIYAVEVPCMRQKDIDKGVRTPEKIQLHIYREMIKDEMNAQEEWKEQGRCLIRGASGKAIRCPCRIPNPDYVPGGDQPKTLPVSCKNCKYEEFRDTHSAPHFSDFDEEDSNGDVVTFEPTAPSARPTGDTIEEKLNEIIRYISENFPRLKETASLYLRGYSLTDISEILEISTSTAFSRIKKIKEIAEPFRDNWIFL